MVVPAWGECYWHPGGKSKATAKQPTIHLTAPAPATKDAVVETSGLPSRSLPSTSSLVRAFIKNAKLLCSSRKAAVNMITDLKKKKKKSPCLGKPGEASRKKKENRTNICCWLTTTRLPYTVHLQCGFNPYKFKENEIQRGSFQDSTSIKWQCWGSNTGLITKSTLSF